MRIDNCHYHKKDAALCCLNFTSSLVFSTSASLHTDILANWPGHVIHLFWKYFRYRLHCITNTFVVLLMFPLTMLFLSLL